MEKYYRFAGIDLAVDIEPERMYSDDLQLAAFRVNQVQNPHRYRACVVSSLKAPEGRELAVLPGSRVYAAQDGYMRYQGAVRENLNSAYACAVHQGKNHEITLTKKMVPGMISARLVMNALDVEHLVSSAGGVILHASYIVWQDRAILFTAPSETGKSTQAELWKCHRGAEIINGDRAALIVGNGQVCAAGLPFSGSSRYCGNRTVPLAAVVYLRQAPATTIRRLRGAEAFRRVWEGCCVNTWNREDMEASAGLVESLLGQAAVYELACTPDETAVEALEEQLRKQVRT